MKKILLFLFVFLLSLNFVGQSNKLDSLNYKIEHAESDSAKLIDLYWKNRYYRSVDSFDLALKVTYEMVNFSKKKLPQKTTWCYQCVSTNYGLKNENEKALNVLLDYQLTVPLDDTLRQAEIFKAIGSKYQQFERYTEALAYFFKAVPYYEKLSETKTINADIAHCYSNLNQENHSVIFNEKSINESIRDSNYVQLASAYLNQGYFYLRLMNHEKSYYYSQLAKNVYLNVLKDSNDRSLGIAIGNIADIYIYYFKYAPDSTYIINPLFLGVKDLKKAMIDTAEYYLDESFRIAKLNNAELIYNYFGYGDLYPYQDKYRKAIKPFLTAFELANNSNRPIFSQRKIADKLYLIYKNLGDAKEALKYYEIYVNFSDSIFNQTKQRELGKQEAKFEFEKQEAKDEALRLKNRAIENARKEHDKAVAKEREKKRNIITYSIALGLLLISFFTAVIFKRLKVAKKQQRVIASQKSIIEKNRNEMLESIEYSKNIQKRIFLSPKELKKLLPHSFLYFKPKDVVSGDFYWVYQKGSKVYFSVADCTGHGVPGAFMSLVSINLINAIILEDDVNSTATILEKLHVRLKERLTSSEEEQMKHGLDMAMCAYDYDTGILEYSGLHNPMYIIDTENELKEIKGDNLFLGISENFNVTSHKIELKKGSTIYLSTDGFPDQKGGEKGKKFYYSRLRNMLRVANTKPMNERALFLSEKFEEWKGDKEQIDDVCVMGVRF